MFLEELNSLISWVRNRITKVKKRIQQKENDYEDMRQAKAGLTNVEEIFQEKKRQHQAVYNNDLFQRNRCLQRLSSSMTNHLTGNTLSVNDGINDVGNRMANLRNEIDDDEKELENLRWQLNDYQAQAKTAVSQNTVEG